MAIIGEKITLDKPLVGNIARNQMESKMELATRGALYVGTGNKTEVTPDGGGDKVPIPETLHIAPNGASDNGKVLVADSKETVGWKITKIKADNLEGGRVAQATNADNVLVSTDTYKPLVDALLELIYPVGSIYMSVNDTNPATFLGGTWERWGQGCVPVGVDASDTDFNAPGKTGGEKNHTLTKDEMPVHAHSAYIHFRGLYVSKLDSTTPTDTGGTYVGGGKATDPGDSSFLDFGSYINDTETAGKGKPHNNLQPYITCYMWKRTA